MSRVADRQGYPEVAEAYKRIAFEEAEHAAKFAELLGEVVTDDTKTNLELRAAAEQGACAGKKELATLAKQLNLDAIHDTVHEMAKDEARHGRVFDGLLTKLAMAAYSTACSPVTLQNKKSLAIVRPASTDAGRFLYRFIV